jgi:hypothetical protein
MIECVFDGQHVNSGGIFAGEKRQRRCRPILQPIMPIDRNGGGMPIARPKQAHTIAKHWSGNRKTGKQRERRFPRREPSHECCTRDADGRHQQPPSREPEGSQLHLPLTDRIEPRLKRLAHGNRPRN